MGPGRRTRTRPTEAVSALQQYYSVIITTFGNEADFFKKYKQDVVREPFFPAGRASAAQNRPCVRRPEPTVRPSALRDITSKLQMPEVDVKLPQSRGNGSPPTSDFCTTSKSVESSVAAGVAKRAFPLPQSSYAHVQM